MMTDEQLNALLTQIDSRPIGEIITDIEVDKQLPTLMKLSHQALSKHNTATFLLLLEYVTQQYPNDPLSALDDNIIDFFREKQSATTLSTFFKHYPEQKHISLINRLGNALNEEALLYLAPFLKDKPKKPLIEALFLSDANVVPLFEYLPLFEIDELISLLSKLKAQDEKNIQFSKCNAIYQTLLKRHDQNRAHINNVFETEHGQGLVSLFLLTPDSHPKPFDFLIDCLTHFKFNPLNQSLTKEIEEHITESLSSQNEASCIELLSQYDKNIGTTAFNQYLLRLLDSSPNKLKLIVAYLKQAKPHQRLSFLALDPSIDEKITTKLLSHLDPTELSMLVLMSNASSTLDTPTITNRLFAYLAEQTATIEDFPIDDILANVRALPDIIFNNLIGALFTTHTGKEKKSALITILLSRVDDFDEKKPLTLDYIKTALITLFTEEASAGSNFKTLFTFNFTSKDNPYPSLFDVFLEKAGQERYFKLLNHLLMLLPPEGINDALTVFYTNPSLCEDFLFTSDLPCIVVETIVDHLGHDDLLALYERLSISLKSDAPPPSNLSALIQSLANRINHSSGDVDFLSSLQDTLFKDPNILTRLLADAKCFTCLTETNLGFIDALRAKHYESLENRGVLLIRAAQALFESDPVSWRKTIRRLAQHLLIDYQATPKILIDRLYSLQQTANHEAGKDLNPFLDTLKGSLYQILKTDEKAYSDDLLTSYISKLSTDSPHLKGVYNAVAIDAAKETNFHIASQQLEKLDGDTTYLSLSQWDVLHMPDILLLSDASSPNWRLFEEMVNQTTSFSTKQALILKLKTFTLSAEVSDEKKIKISHFIIDHLYEGEALTDESLDALAHIIKFIPADYRKEGQSNLFFHELLTDSRELSDTTIDSIISLLKISITHNEPLEIDSLNVLLNHPDLTNEQALSSLFASFSTVQDATLYLKWIEQFYATQTPAFQKKCLALSLQKQQYDSLDALSLLTKQFSGIQRLNRFSDDHTNIVKPLLSQLSTHLLQALTTQKTSDVATSFSLIQTLFTQLLNNNVSWCKEIFDNNECLQLFEHLLKTSTLPENQSHEQLLKLIASLPAHFTEELLSHIQNESIKHDVYDLLIVLLTEDKYAAVLPKNHYEALFRLLPSTRKQHVSTIILDKDVLTDWQHSYRFMLAHSLAPTTLFELYKTHNQHPLYAHLLLHHPETYEHLDKDSLKAVLQSININTELDKLFQTLSPVLIPKLSHAVIEHLASPHIDKWFSSVNLYDDTFIRLLNGIVALNDQKSLKKLIDKKGDLYTTSHYVTKINHALAHFEGEYTIYKDGLLSDYLRTFINSPLNLKDCSEKTRYHLIENLDIDHITQILAHNEAFLDNALSLRDLMIPFNQAGPSDGTDDELLHSHHHVYLSTARWFLNLPLIVEGNINHKTQLDSLKSLLPGLDTLPEAMRIWFKAHDELVQTPFTHQTKIQKHTNHHYERIESIIASVSEGLSILRETHNPQYDKAIHHLEEMNVDLTLVLKQHDEKCHVLQKAGGNLDTLFSIDSHLAKITKGGYVASFPKGFESSWIGVLKLGHEHISSLYDAYASGVLSAIEASFKICTKSEEVKPSQKAFIQMALLSPHVVNDEKRIEKACQILAPEDLKDILSHYQIASNRSDKTVTAFQALYDYVISHFEIKSIITYLYEEQFPTALLDEMAQVSKEANALGLYNIINFVSQAKKTHIPLSDAIKYLLPSDTSEHSEDNWIYNDINKTLNVIYKQHETYQQIYQHALSYKPHKSPENAQKTLNHLGQLQHQVMGGKHIAFLLNSYAKATHMVNGSSRIDIRYLQNALYRLTLACDYDKQITLFAHLDVNLLRDVLLASVNDLSSADFKVRREASNLIDYVTAYGLRDDIDSELKNTIRKTLSQDHFNRYTDIITPIIDDLVKHRQAPSHLTEITYKQLTTSTIDGVWIQRIVTSPKVVAKLTPEELKELVERYRRISQFLKTDEYNVYQKWEDKAKAHLTELRITVSNQEDRLERQKQRFKQHFKLSKSENDELKSIKDLISTAKQKISRIEDKKRRILKFKANDSIRALLQHLQLDIETLKSSDLGLATQAQAVFSQYLELELKEYKASALSKLFDFMHDTITPDGDLAKQNSILSRLAEKYIPHCNFATKELLRKSLIDPVREGAEVFNEQGIAIAILDENSYLVTDILSTTEDSIEDEAELLINTPKGKVGMSLYNADKQAVGFLTKEGKYSPDNLFIAKTSLELLCHTPLSELDRIQLLTPDLIQDVIKEKQVGQLYDKLLSPLNRQEDTEDKKEWIFKQVQTGLLNSKLTIDRESAKRLVQYHQASDYDTLLQHSIKHNRDSALHLIEAYLGNNDKAKALLSSNNKKESLFQHFDLLKLSGTDVLSFSTASQFPHSLSSDVRSLLKLYQMTKADTVGMLGEPRLCNMIIDISSSTRSSPFHDTVNGLKSSLLTPTIAKSLHRDVRVEMLLTPSHYSQLSQENFNALFSTVNHTDIEAIYRYFLTHHIDRLFFDKGLVLFLKKDPTLFYKVLKNHPNKHQITERCLTHPAITQAVFDTLPQKEKLKFSDDIPLSSLFSSNSAPFYDLFSTHSFMSGIHAYVNGYNNSPELACILSNIISTKLEGFLKGHLSDRDIKALTCLVDDPHFTTLHQRFPLYNDLFSQLVETAGKTEVTSLFYTPSQAFDVSFAKRKIHCSLLSDVYSHISETSFKDKSWSVLRDLSWETISKKTKAFINRLPWVNNGTESTVTWHEIKSKSLEALQLIGGEVKTIDLYLLNYQGSTDKLKTLLNDYCYTYYSQEASKLPNQALLSNLHSTLRLLDNEHISKSVKTALFDVLQSHPRLRDKSITAQMAHYNISALLQYHGKRKQYDDIIQLYQDNTSIRDTFPALRKAHDEAILEKRLQSLSSASWINSFKTWWARVWQYSWHGFFVPNKPRYVVYHSQSLEGLMLAPSPKTEVRPILALMSKSQPPVVQLVKIKDLLRDIQNTNTPFPLEDCLTMLEELEGYQSNYQTPIEDDIHIREAIHAFYLAISHHEKTYASTDPHTISGFSKIKTLAPQNRKVLLELYHHATHNSDISYEAQSNHLLTICKENPELSAVNKQILEDHPDLETAITKAHSIDPVESLRMVMA